MNILITGDYPALLRAFMIGTSLVRKHFGDDSSLRSLYVRFVTLNLLLEQDAITVGQLSTASGIPLATVSRFVWHCLQEGSLVEMIDPDDRRRRLLRANAAGERAMQEFADEWATTMGGPMPDLQEFLKRNPK